MNRINFTTVESKYDPATLRAMVDAGADDEFGLERIKHFETCAYIVHKLKARLSVEELLQRIKNSAHEEKMLEYLPYVYGHSAEALRPVANILLRVGEEWSTEALTGFAITYWQTEVRSRIVSHDFRRAFDEVKKSYRGFTEKSDAGKPFDISSYAGTSLQLALPPEKVRDLVKELYGEMRAQDLLTVVSQDIITAQSSEVRTILSSSDVPTSTGRQRKPREYSNRVAVPGYEFASALSATEFKKFDQVGQMVLAIARHMSNQREVKRKRRHEKAVVRYAESSSK